MGFYDLLSDAFNLFFYIINVKKMCVMPGLTGHLFLFFLPDRRSHLHDL